MKTKHLLIMVLGAALLGAAAIAWTGNPHFVGPVTATLLEDGQNGQISQCLIIAGPPEVDPFCPGGQTETLAQVTYSRIRIKITDLTNNITVNARPATLSQTLFVCP